MSGTGPRVQKSSLDWKNDMKRSKKLMENLKREVTSV